MILLKVNVVVVLAIGLNGPAAETVEDSQRITEPVLPVKLNVPVFVALHIGMLAGAPQSPNLPLLSKVRK